MGCGGGFGGLFRMMDDYGHAGRGCGSHGRSHHGYHHEDDTEEKLMLIKKMYAEGLLNDEEYQMYTQSVYDRRISFDELMAMKRKKSNKPSGNIKQMEAKPEPAQPYSKFKTRLKELNESKKKITQVQDKLLASIQDLEKEKKRMEALAETMLKSSEETAEKYINKKIDLEENIQNLVRRNKELEIQAEEIDSVMKELEAKELELEAVRLQEELSRIRFEND